MDAIELERMQLVRREGQLVPFTLTGEATRAGQPRTPATQRGPGGSNQASLQWTLVEGGTRNANVFNGLWPQARCRNTVTELVTKA